MSSTTHSEWPLPRWSAYRMEELNAATSNGAADPFESALAQVKLLGSAGKFAEAHDFLSRMQVDFPQATIRHGLFRNLLAAAVLVHAPEMAAAWLVRRFQATYDLTIGVLQSSAPPEIAAFQVQGNAARFFFPPSLFDPAREVVLQRWTDIFPLFDTFMTSRDRIDGVVAINLGDGGYWPGLCFCDYRPEYFLIPDALYMDSERYNPFRLAIDSETVAWPDRIPVAFWRGATTGIPPDRTLGWRSLPRIRLCEIARDNPATFDAGITNVVQIDDPLARGWLEASGLMRDHVPSRSFQRYRYQIDIDGNTNSWPGLIMKLLSGSPVLKIASRSGHQQWYYDRLRPWINFVPVASDMADLVEKVAWLGAHDDIARRIGEAGRELGEALGDEREIANAAPVIAAAIRATAKAPIVDLAFGLDKPGNATLRTGWRIDAADGAVATGLDAHLELPKPAGLDDTILTVDVSLAARRPQRLTIVANGEIVSQRLITGRTTLYCPLRRSVAAAGETLCLDLYFPDSLVNASRATPLDARRLSVALHRIRITAAHCFAGNEQADIAPALAELHAGEEALVSRDPWAGGAAAFPADRLSVLHTVHGTILFADVRSGSVRHGRAEAVPRNLFLVEENGAAKFVRANGDGGRQYYVPLRPEGQFAAGTVRDATAPDGLVQIFEMIDAGVAERPTFGLRGAGLFVCAEPDGSITLSRVELGGWERFTSRAIGADQEV